MVAVGGALDDEAEAEVEADGDWVQDGKDSFVSVSSSWRILPRYRTRK